MRWRLASALVLAAALCAPAPVAGAAPHNGSALRVRAEVGAADRAAAARVARYWTPARMRSAVPLDMTLSADGRLRPAPPLPPLAIASFRPVPTPIGPPYAVNGRIFVRQGNKRGYCSGTAINSPTRQLVLTAAHCVNSGPREDGKAAIWSRFLQFVPAYTGGSAPYGAFVARRGQVFASQQWIKQGNPDYDFGAFLTFPNAEGVNVADAVGGGALIALDQSRHQQFESFGYPGSSTRLQRCRSPYIGDDPLTYRFSGPPTMGIQCRWAPGASGGGWLINAGTEVNGVNAYLHRDNKSNTYGPYFSSQTVGKLIAGL